jgi:hypothetical protein
MSQLGHYRKCYALMAASPCFPPKTPYITRTSHKNGPHIMPGLKIIIPISLIFTLSACETPEEQTARLEQFQGKTVAEVASIIGAPAIQNKTTAVWYHESIHTDYQPIYRPYGYGYGSPYGYGHRRTYRLKCTYTATLKSGRVAASSYKGNSCARFAPKIKKPKSNP